MILTLPMPPNWPNARMHWAAKHRAGQAWKLEALVKEPQLRGKHKPPHSVQIQARFYLGRKQFMDADNSVSRLKLVVDFLKERGLIVDDKWPHVRWAGFPEQYPNKPRRLELTLTALPEDTPKGS
jgi:hypothetical protein